MDRKHLPWGAATGIVALALLVRLLCVYQTRDVPTARHLIGDAARYVEWAGQIAAGNWIGKESFYQAPLYPYVLAVCLRVWGSSADALRIVQAVWGAAACGCLCIGTSRLFDRRTGIVAGLMLAMYGPAVYYDGIIQKESLAGLLTCGLVLLTAWIIRDRRGWMFALLGFIAALLCITRENAFVWAVLLAFWTSFIRVDPSVIDVKPSRFGCWRWVALYALGLAVVLFPVGLRNRLMGGEWSVSTFQAGPNFYIGNHRGADGRYQPLVRGHETPIFERADATNLAQKAIGRPLSAREVSGYWFDKASDEIGADVGAWVRLSAYKALLVLNRYEIADAESFNIYRESSLVLAFLGRAWHFGLLVPAAAIGWVATWKDRRRLWLYPAMAATMTAAVAAFYVLGRYRYPLVPLLIPFAAAGLLSLSEAIRARSWSMTGRLLLAGLITGIVANVSIQDERRLDALATMNAGVALAQADELDQAISWFERALADHPGSAEGHNNLAQALALRGRFQEAIPHFEMTLILAPDLIGVNYNLGVAYENVGRTDEALGHYKKAMDLDPGDNDAQAAWARLQRR